MINIIEQVYHFCRLNSGDIYARYGYIFQCFYSFYSNYYCPNANISLLGTLK